ncbi:MAG TPA: hypothetical protein VKU44_01805 [Terriglobia bacterium]|nr:hypothetical protein [Terriglobia bacterium]
MRLRSLIAGLLLASSALAQDAAPVLRGRWTATIGPAQVLRGTWSAQASPDNPNSAQGSWTLTGDSGQIIGDGTWSAQKTRQGWQGTWTARAARGRALAGTWKADLPSVSPKNLLGMLQMTQDHQVGGTWRSGGYTGNWWLKGRAGP